jgi:hypothetical protein
MLALATRFYPGIVTYEVVSKELHNEGRVLVALLRKSVQLCRDVRKRENTRRFRIMHTSDCVIKSLLGELASRVRRVQDLVVEDREVESKAETNRVRRSQAGSSNLGGSFVCLERLIGRSLARVTHGKFGEVAVVIALPAHHRAVSL